MTQLWSVTCHMGSHSVTCHPTQGNTPRLNPSHTAGTQFAYPDDDDDDEMHIIMVQQTRTTCRYLERVVVAGGDDKVSMATHHVN